MELQKILLPVSTAKCPFGAFDLINRFSQRSDLTVILLHVVTLNLMAPENRIYEELGWEAEWCLQQLAEKSLRPEIATVIRVRFGEPAEEILAEAKAEHPHLLLLPIHPLSFRKRSVFPWHPRSIPAASSLVRRILSSAPCDVLVVPSSRIGLPKLPSVRRPYCQPV